MTGPCWRGRDSDDGTDSIVHAFPIESVLSKRWSLRSGSLLLHAHAPAYCVSPVGYTLTYPGVWMFRFLLASMIQLNYCNVSFRAFLVSFEA